jgi:hypothetical protein
MAVKGGKVDIQASLWQFVPMAFIGCCMHTVSQDNPRA